MICDVLSGPLTWRLQASVFPAAEGEGHEGAVLNVVAGDHGPGHPLRLHPVHPRAPPQVPRAQSPVPLLSLRVTARPAGLAVGLIVSAPSAAEGCFFCLGTSRAGIMV